MRPIIRVMFTGFVVSIFGCGEGAHSPPTAPVSAQYALKPVASANARISLLALSGQRLEGRVRVNTYYREFALVGGVSKLVEWRVASVMGDAADAFPLFVQPIPGDFTGDGKVDFDDFFLFADVFGSREGSEKFGAEYDFDGSNAIDFTDFFIFADYFGRTVSAAAGKRAVASPVQYELAPRGGMLEEQFSQAWDELQGRLANPRPSAKALVTEPEYRFEVISLDGLFETFSIIVSGAFPISGAESREISVTPEGIAPAPEARAIDVIPIPIGGVARIALSDIFTVYGGIERARILETTGGLSSTLAGLTLEVSGGAGLIGHVSVEVTDIAGLSGTNTVLFRTPTLRRTLAVSPADTTVAAESTEPVPFRGTLTVFADNVENSAEEVLPIPASRDTVRHEDGTLTVRASYSYKDLTAAQVITVLAPLPVPPRVTARMTRYTSAPASGRGIEIRVDVASATEPVRSMVRVLARAGGEKHSEFPLSLTESLDPYHWWGYFTFDVPPNEEEREILWTIAVEGASESGLVNSSSVEFPQAALDPSSAPSTPPPVQPPPPPPSAPSPSTPPPAVVAPSINSASVNGVAPGGTIGPLPFGTTLVFSVSVSGTDPSVSWTMDGAPITLAKSGTLTLTTANSAGTDTRTWNVITFGAP